MKVEAIADRKSRSRNGILRHLIYIGTKAEADDMNHHLHIWCLRARVFVRVFLCHFRFYSGGVRPGPFDHRPDHFRPPIFRPRGGVHGDWVAGCQSIRHLQGFGRRSRLLHVQRLPPVSVGRQQTGNVRLQEQTPFLAGAGIVVVVVVVVVVIVVFLLILLLLP